MVKHRNLCSMRVLQMKRLRPLLVHIAHIHTQKTLGVRMQQE